MKVLGTVPVFHVSDIAVSLKYYTNILGFRIDFQNEKYIGLKMGEAGLHLFEKATVTVPLAHRPRDVGAKVLGGSERGRLGAGTAYFFCDEVDSYYAAINDTGALVQGEPQEYSYGMRDFIVADPDGNHLTFGCPGASR